MQCGMCKSPDTLLTKNSSTRLHDMKCNKCGATRSCAAIKAGYHATAKGERKAARNKGMGQVTGWFIFYQFYTLLILMT